MTCANCAANIERGVKKLKGVGDASVNFAAENAAVSFDPQQLQLLHQSIDDLSLVLSSNNHQQQYQRLLPLSFHKEEGESRGYADDATWILTASFVILTMQSGFGLLEAGSCSPGYEINVMMKNIVDAHLFLPH